MSEQTIQNDIFSNSVILLDKYECLNLGSTTVRDLIDSKKLKNVKVSKNNLNKKPDVLIVDKEGRVIVYNNLAENHYPFRGVDECL